MKQRWFIWLLLFLLPVNSCWQEEERPLSGRSNVPDGTPITMTIGFGAMAPVEVEVGTKAAASLADESRVHDLYVLIFNNGTNNGAVEDADRKCIYGRYFSYQERCTSIDELNQVGQREHEVWYVENKSLDNVLSTDDGYVSKTTGAVKLSTTAAQGCTIVLLANVSNTLTSLSGEDAVIVLNSFKNNNKSLAQLKALTVQLEQNLVERSDLFLMTGIKKLPNDVSTADMIWHQGTADEPVYEYNDDYKIQLKHVDAKVKFRIRKNDTNITSLTPRTWQVFNVPSCCTLFEQDSYTEPAGLYYFQADPPAYFEDKDGAYDVFTFYMLESQLTGNTPIPNANNAASYYMRDLSVKQDDGDTGYQKNTSLWQYAPDKAPYVVFKASLELNHESQAVTDHIHTIDGTDLQGASAEASFTVHLGEFYKNGVWNNDNYETHRGRFYTYNVTINNATSIYTEVDSFDPDDIENHPGEEPQPGQEGSLLLISNGVVNCDAHYEYKSISFNYNSTLAAAYAGGSNEYTPTFSWYVKTPFNKDKNDGAPTWDSGNKRYNADPAKIDYLWVKFRINRLVDGHYSQNRQPYPNPAKAAGGYNPDWIPNDLATYTIDVNDDGETDLNDIPNLMDINQLINFIYYQYKLKYDHDVWVANGDNEAAEPPLSIFDNDDIIEVTAFVDEYYYEKHPLTGQTDPDLWRDFVNADPREMHILSDVKPSRDRQSNVVNASHSILQKSIQTIYNVDAPDLSSLWGTEHEDEMRKTDGWGGWDWGISNGATTYATSNENGRLNTAALWGLYPSGSVSWTTFLNYDVINTLPELRSDYRKMAYSCLTRNRDNDGDGIIDREEVRWYLASINQLKGMWIGNEALSSSARVYQPIGNDWRAHVISSTCPSRSDKPKVLTSEEGLSTFDYGDNWAGGNERARESVRCVRNLGTYKVGNVDADISGSPYTQEVDNYYTVEERKDPDHPTDAQYSDYAFRFFRLSPLSLREFVDKELPFHNELSVNNKVYLELYVQNRKARDLMYGDDYDYRDGKSIGDMGEINETITSTGHNPYCPEGYRLPNQSELGIMTLTLPSSFWGNSVTRAPSRTYFSKGYYAISTQQVNSERNKTGWVYSTSGSSGNIRLPNKSEGTKQIRCVRDSEQTGTITGKMHLDRTYFNVGATCQLYFNFSSSASAFAKADDYSDYAPKLYLCYKDQYNNDVQLDFTDKMNAEIDPLGKLRFDEYLEIKMQKADISPAPNYPADMQFKLELTNKRMKPDVRSFYTDFTLTDNLGEVRCDLEIMPGRNEEKGFPINVSAESNMSSIETLKLYVRKKEDPNYTLYKDLSANVNNAASYSEVVYFKPQTLNETMYYFYVTGTDATDVSGESDTKAMEVLKVNYTPNPDGAADGHLWKDDWWQTYANASGWLNTLPEYIVDGNDYRQRGYINVPFEGIKVRDLNFAAGDFIEADMDVSNCVFIKTVEGDLNSNPYKSQNIGLDNIFSVGKTRIDWQKGATENQLHFYYPAHKGAGNDQLQLDPVVSYSVFSKIALGNIINGDLVLRLDQDGAKYNGNAVPSDSNYDSVISALTSSHTLVIGAMEGNHLSRAKYNYVRVIHNDIKDIPHDGDTGFNGDPQNGGNL